METQPLSLSEVTNNYGTYRGNSLVGDRGSVGTVSNDGLDGINGVNYPFLSGIIVNINGVSYTHIGYLNQLKLMANPFISKSTLPTVSFTLDQLVEEKEDIIVYEGVTRTQYAEASVTKRMNTIDDILLYLNDFFNPNASDTVLSPYVIGSWVLNTTSYSADLDVVGEYPGLQFESQPGLGIRPSTPPTFEQPKKPEPIPIIDVPEPKPIEIIKPKPEPVPFVPPREVKISPDIPTPITNPIPSNPAPNMQTVGTSATFGVYNYGQGFTNGAAAAEVAMQAMQPKKPNFTGTFTGQPGTGPDGSKWVWIPFQGGWTRA